MPGIAVAFCLALPALAASDSWLARPPALRFRRSSATAAAVPFGGAAFPPFVFSGRGGRVSALLESACAGSKTGIDAALYSLSIPGAADALVAAKRRGVLVRVVVDSDHVKPAKRSRQFQQLLDAGIELRELDGGGAYGSMHNKFALFDDALLETGSFNWTTWADGANHENAIFRDDSDLLAGYRAYWEWLWRRAAPVAPGGASAAGFAAAEEPDDAPKGEDLDLQDAAAAPAVEPPPGCPRSVSFGGRAFPACSFSPRGPTQDELAEAVRLAKTSVDVAMFSFYAPGLADALLEAKRRGVLVRLVLEPSQARQSPLTKFFVDNGFPVRLTAGHGKNGVMHDKFAVFDRALLVTGSYNWTVNAALNNFENTVFSVHPADAAGFSAEFETLFTAGAPPPGARASSTGNL